MTDRGKPIAPLKYLASGQDEECTKALDRFMERYDPRSFHDLLDSIPSMSHGLTVVPDGFHEYHRRVCDYRYEHAFMEAWRELHPTVGFPSSPEAVSYTHLVYEITGGSHRSDFSYRLLGEAEYKEIWKKPSRRRF